MSTSEYLVLNSTRRAQVVVCPGQFSCIDRSLEGNLVYIDECEGFGLAEITGAGRTELVPA